MPFFNNFKTAFAFIILSTTFNATANQIDMDIKLLALSMTCTGLVRDESFSDEVFDKDKQDFDNTHRKLITMLGDVYTNSDFKKLLAKALTESTMIYLALGEKTEEEKRNIHLEQLSTCRYLTEQFNSI